MTDYLKTKKSDLERSIAKLLEDFYSQTFLKVEIKNGCIQEKVVENIYSQNIIAGIKAIVQVEVKL